MILKNKRGSEMALDKTVLIILGILVLIFAVFMLTNSQILSWIKNLPGGGSPKDKEIELTPDQMRILGYEKVGKVDLEVKSTTFFRQNYISYLQQEKFSKEECQAKIAKGYKYEWKKVCYDSYGTFADNPDEKACAKKVNAIFDDACLNENGFLAYNQNYIPTSIYVDWNVDDSSNGILKISSFGNDAELGTLKNNFLVIDSAKYNANQKYLEAKGITQEMILRLNAAKYITGGLYRDLNAPKSFLWMEIVQAKSLKIDNSKITVSDGKNFIDLSPYLTLKSKDADKMPGLYLGRCFSQDYLSLLIDKPTKVGASMVCSYLVVGKLSSDGVLFLTKDYSLLTDYYSLSSEVKFSPIGENINYQNYHFYQTNLELDPDKISSILASSK